MTHPSAQSGSRDGDSSGRPGGFDELEPVDPGVVVGELWSMLESVDDLGAVLQQLVDIAGRMFPTGYEASITILARADHPETVATTTQAVLPLDKAQYDANDGPCLEAARTRKPVRTDLDGAKQRWPHFAAAAEAAGIVGYLSAPLLNDHAVIGSFNLYSRTAEHVDAFDAALLTMFTNAALAAVANAERHRASRTKAEQLRTAMESRAVIDQAVGVLMCQHDLTAAQAWHALSTESQNRNIKVRDLAADIVHHLGRQTS